MAPEVRERRQGLNGAGSDGNESMRYTELEKLGTKA